jgi:septum site-determining protein MinC
MTKSRAPTGKIPRFAAPTLPPMAVVSKLNAVFELKSAALTLVAVVLKTTDLAELSQAFEDRFGNAAVFDNDPVAIDLSPVRQARDLLDFVALVALLRRYRMLPIAVKNGNPEQLEAALAAGLCEAPEGVSAIALPRHEPVMPPAAPEVVLTEVIREVPVPIAAPGTIIIDKPLRSGQQVYARGGDLVVLSVVSFGAEVIADGNIHVYAPLRGRALAGARGNAQARIFTTCLEPQLVSIAGIYRTTETALPPEVLGKPAQVRLEGEKLLVEALKP